MCGWEECVGSILIILIFKIYLNFTVNIELEISMAIEVFPGEDATFSCSAAIFASELTYRWIRLYVNGSTDVIHETDGGVVLSGNMLVIENVDYFNDGTAYYCKSFGFRSSKLSYLNGKYIYTHCYITNRVMRSSLLNVAVFLY